MSEPSRPTLDDALMAAAKRGDHAAFELLVHRHVDALHAVFRRLGLDRHAAEDCVQETFLRLLKSRAGYRRSAPFRAFLMVLARNTFVDCCRRQREPPLSTVAASAEEPAQVSRTLPGGIEPEDLRAVVAALPEAQRLVLQLSLWDGLRYREVAALLDVPVGTVKSRVHTAIQRLREALRHDLVP